MYDAEGPELDDVLSILSEQRARFVCYHLMAEDVADVNELYLAREVAAWETGIELSLVPTEQVMQILDVLQDDLLPQLDEIELVAYDPGRGTVRYGDPPEPIERLVKVCQSIEQPRSPS